jgi:sodium-dependent dicarboxylate transporter 2/3/5
VVLGTEVHRIPIDDETIETRLRALGAMSSGERRVLGVFTLVAGAWMTRGFLIEPVVPMVDDAAIAIFGALLLSVVPVTEDGELTFLLDWTTAVMIPWGIILLFGGGLSLAAGVESTGLGEWFGTLLFGLEGVDIVVILLTLGLLAVFLTEVTSNTALTAMIIPILATLAAALAIHPYLLMAVATSVASFAFMLPVVTPPNAVVFGSGYMTSPQMARIGFVLNLVGVVLAVLFGLVWLPIAWNVDLGTVPPWLG